MRAKFSKSWISSTKPNKQRKYRFNAPLHIRGSFLNVHLSKELRQKYNTRALRVRVGDKVKIMVGQYKKQEGKVEEVNMRKLKIYVAKIEHVKKDGTKTRYPINPSNLMIVELNTDDKKRLSTNKPSVDKKPTVVKQNVEKKIEIKPTSKPAKSSKIKSE